MGNNASPDDFIVHVQIQLSLLRGEVAEEFFFVAKGILSVFQTVWFKGKEVEVSLTVNS